MTKRITELPYQQMIELMTKVFLEQPLASPGSAKQSSAILKAFIEQDDNTKNVKSLHKQDFL